MRRRFAAILPLLLLSSIPAFGAACASAGNGNWATPATWTSCGGGVPQNGDSSIISHIVTVSTIVTVGTSPATGGLASIALGTTGRVNITGTLNVRGPVTSGSGTDVAVDTQAGGTFRFDATQNLGQYYTYSPSGQRIFQAAGTAGSCAYNGAVYAGATCATVTSDLTGGALPGSTTSSFSGAINFSYAAVSNLGDAGRDAIAVEQFGFLDATTIAINHSSFFNSGRLSARTNTNVDVEYTAFSGGLNTQDSSEDVLLSNIPTANTKIFRRNVMNSRGHRLKALNMFAWDMKENQLINGLEYSESTPGDASASIFDDSLFLNIDIGVPSSTFLRPYVFIDLTSQDNPHFIAPQTAGGAQTVDGLVCESPDERTSDGGECVLQATNNPGSATATTAKNVLLLPAKTGVATANLTSLTNINLSNYTLNITHATGICLGNCIQIDESGASNSHVTMAASIVGSSNGTAIYKAVSLSTGAPSTDTITSADYNAGLPAITLTNTSCPLCTNQGNGYATKRSAPGLLGPHDLDITAGAPVAPAFANMNRRMATWDTLGTPANTACAAWVTATVYTYVAASPTCVSVSNSGVYGSLSINYRLTVSHTSGASTKPDSGASWRADWEYASLYDLRIATVSGAIYSGLAPVAALRAFVGSGWTPTAAQYRFTFPGDTNPVTNMGAFQMPVSSNVIRHRVSQ